MHVIVPLLHICISINYTESVIVQSGKEKPLYVLDTREI